MQETDDKISTEELLRMTTEVTSAYVSNNLLPAAQLPEVIKAVHHSLATLNAEALKAL